MTVHIKDGKFRLFLWWPNCFLSFAVKKIYKHIDDENANCVINAEKVRKKTQKKVVKSIREAKKTHGKIELVSVKSADGTYVKITL